ncbi:hypothetical protein HYQ46_000312 [Verticillium longisporum]|nr:hypothetical protein HYQ46_000312 [Verticillium longisporum]
MYSWVPRLSHTRLPASHTDDLPFATSISSSSSTAHPITITITITIVIVIAIVIAIPAGKTETASWTPTANMAYNKRPLYGRNGYSDVPAATPTISTRGHAHAYAQRSPSSTRACFRQAGRSSFHIHS